MRRSNDKIIGGICSGLAQYVGADVTLVRLITLFGIIASGVVPGGFLYVICLIIVPLDSQAGGYNAGGPGPEGFDGSNHNSYYDTSRSNEPSSNNTRYIIGIGLIGLGIYLFARLFFGWLRWEYIFAGFLIIGGLFMMFGGNRRSGR